MIVHSSDWSVIWSHDSTLNCDWLQELKEEELAWLDYTQDEYSVKHALVDDVFSVLLEDSVLAVTGAYNKQRRQLTSQLQVTYMIY